MQQIGVVAADSMRLRSVPPLVYHPLYSCPTWPAGHRFAMSKFSDMAVELAHNLPASATTDRFR